MTRGRQQALALGALVALMLVVLLGFAAPARAQTAPEKCPAADLGLPCIQDRIGIPGIDLGDAIVDPVKEAAEDKFCPKKPPTVRAPSMDVPWAEPGGKTQFQQYGYAGLQITTHEEGCFAQISTSGATGVNEGILAVDELVNATQVTAVGDGVNSQMDKVLPDALAAIGDAFWGEWMPVAAAAAGLVCILLGTLGRAGLLVTVGGNVLVVMAVVPFLLGNGGMLTDLSNRMTTGVASTTSSKLLQLHPSTAGTAADAAFGDAYYTIAWVGHIQQSFGGHDKCADEFAAQFVPTKAFSYDEMARINAGDQALEARLVKEKGDRWNALADEMKAKYPGCYAAWANPEGAWNGVMKHGAVTGGAGLPVMLFALAVLIAKFLLPFGLLFLAGMGVVAVVQHRLTAAFAGLLVAGLAGPPMLALASGTMMFWFYVVMSDPATAWWWAIASALGLGVAAVIGMKMLGPALIGFAFVGSAGKMGRRGGKRGRQNLQRGRTHGAVLAGGAAAVAAAAGSRGGGGVGSGPGPDDPGQPAGFHDGVPGQVDAAAAAPGLDVEGWWNDAGAAPTPTPASPTSRVLHPEPPVVFGEPTGSPDDPYGIVSRSPADVPQETPMTSSSPDTATDDGYQPGVTHQLMPEPSTGDQDLVKDTWRRATAGRASAPAIGDNGSLFAPDVDA